MRLRTLFIALLSSCIITISAQDTLLLFHPTVYNLELIKSLLEQGMLDLEGYHILGVYHSGEAYNYDSAITKVCQNTRMGFSP